MDSNIEIAFTPTGVVKRRVSEEAVTDAVAEFIIAQVARNLTVFTPNLIDTGCCCAHTTGHNGRENWIRRLRKVSGVPVRISWIC